MSTTAATIAEILNQIESMFAQGQHYDQAYQGRTTRRSADQ